MSTAAGFPPPDNVARAPLPPIHIASFAASAPATPLYPVPPIPPSLRAAAAEACDPDPDPDPAASADPHELLTPLVAALARPDLAPFLLPSPSAPSSSLSTLPPPPPLPTLADLLASSSTSSLQQQQQQQSPSPRRAPAPVSAVTLAVAVYGAHSPRLAATFEIAAHRTLSDLVARVPCPLRGTPRLPATLLLDDGARRAVGPPAPDVPLAALRLRLGAPYPLRHGADCEHVLVFTDVSAPLIAAHGHSAAQATAVATTATGLVSAEQTGGSCGANSLLPATTSTSAGGKSGCCESGTGTPDWPVVLPCHICRRRAASRLSVSADPLAPSPSARLLYCFVCYADAHICEDGSLHKDSRNIVTYDLPTIDGDQ